MWRGRLGRVSTKPRKADRHDMPFESMVERPKRLAVALLRGRNASTRRFIIAETGPDRVERLGGAGRYFDVDHI